MSRASLSTSTATQKAMMRDMRSTLLLLALLPALSGCGQKTCSSDGDCTLPARCGADRVCAVLVPDGSECTKDSQCAGQACIFTAGVGACGIACKGPSDCAPSARCAPVVDARTEGSSLRLTCGAVTGDRYTAETCTNDAACFSGLCHDGHCTTPCGTCPRAFTCLPATLTREGLSLDHGVCSWWPVAPVVELGPIDTLATSAQPVGFTLPAGFGAFTLVLEDFDNQVPVVTRLVAPDGTVLIGNPRPPDAGSVDLARCSSSQGNATVLVPGSDDPRALPGPGRYQLEVVTFDAVGFPLMPRQVAGRIERIAAVLKRAARGGLVDLTVHVAPETGFSVADGGGTFVRGMLERFEQVTREKLGIALGQVRLVSLPPDAGASITTFAQARALWSAYSVGAPASRPINVMLVRDISFAAGVAGDSPGAPGVYGRPASGVAVSPLASGAATTGVLLAHEVSHFLGLFHTSDGFLGDDLITDTPGCGNPSLGGGCPDARNLMFPFFPTREPLFVSAGQARVLEGSPWLYQWVHPGACGEVDTMGLTTVGYFAGTTLGAKANLVGACGGSGGEVVHLLRLDGAVGKLEVTVTGAGFTPVLYLRKSQCAAGASELACAVADGGVATASVNNPGTGAFFVIVDSVLDGGTYEVAVTITP